MAKDYIAGIIDVRSDSYLNPSWPQEARSIGSIDTIVVHHDASIRPHDYDSLARYRQETAGHYQSLGPGLQYHFKIDNVGTIFWIRPFEQALYHAGNYPVNRTSIAICLDGYFHPPYNQLPTREQYESLKQLLTWLCTQHPEFPAVESDVFGHREVSQLGTACPGDTLFPFVADYRNGNGSVIIPDVPYDWPDQQPATPAPKAKDPQPTPPTIVVNYRVYRDGKQIGAYTKEENAWNKYTTDGGQMILDGAGNDVTTQFIAKYVSPKPLPANPPADVPKTDPADTTNPNNKPIPIQIPTDTINETNTIVKQILAIVQWVKDLLSSIFKKGG